MVIALAVVGMLIVGGAMLLTRGSDGTADGAPAPSTVSTTLPQNDDSRATTVAPMTSTTSTTVMATTTSTTVPATTTSTTVPPTTTMPPTTVPLPPPPPLAFTVPIQTGISRDWGDGHGGDYAAADVFADCGSTIVSPTNGLVIEARPVNTYDSAVDNPATRGGISITILGDDGVRYYLAHMEYLPDALQPGVRVDVGTPIGAVGLTGRTSACHVHLGLSPDCGGTEWKVRRGAIWPQPYLSAWAAGEMRSPRTEIDQWLAANPNACAEALADPFAADA